MEPEKQLENKYEYKYDENNLKHVLWGYTLSDSSIAKKFFTNSTIKYISKKVTENLMGLEDKPIIVTNDKISHVMSQVYQNIRPKTGDIYSRYIIPDDGSIDIFQELVYNTIEIITNAIRTEVEIITNNKKLSIWSTVYGSFNPHNLRQHAPIKILNKHPQHMMFNMNY